VRAVRDRVGKFTSLDRLLDEHFGAVEADFLSHYQIDLAEALWGRGDPRCDDARKFLSLVEHLPRDGALHRALDPAAGGWSQTDELVATSIEVLAMKLDVVATMVHNLVRMWAKDDPGPYKTEPVEIPRPDAIEKQRAEIRSAPRKQSSMAEIAQFLRNATSNVA
jgi:hypothetical protein